ncbi:MAG: hypothetical protein LBI04_02655 [Treponema sp.]|nr:hypothetical protein [Treponema sp.]
MANKKLWWGMLVMALVFGMTVIGCEEDEPQMEPAIFFDWDITVKDIPSSLNGQNFTMSIIRDDIVKTSKTGVVADGKATANLKIKDMAPKSEITLDVFGKELWVAYVAIKIGTNQQLVKEYSFSKLPDGSDTNALVNGWTGGWPYSDFN